MSRLIPEQTLQAIEQAADIVQIVSRYVTLKQRGQTQVGLCPFHNEKTGSFHVYPERGIYVCYGCGKKGGIFHFMMEIEGLHFREAVREVGREVGIQVSSEGDSDSDLFAQLRDTVSWAAEQFAQTLWSPAGESGLRYMTGRGFNEETLRRFGVGFAPSGWERLISVAREQGRSIDLLAQVGLVKLREDGSAYDAFRDRVIFPIHDLRGRPIAFGGRIMPEAASDHAPKYINSPESPLYQKSSTLYGYSHGVEQIRESRRIIIAEGYTDVMMPHQCGQHEVVAVCGTALTPKHASLLARLADEVVFLFDADPAGLRATERSLELLLPHELRVRVARLPEGSDPHEFLIDHGTEAFARAIEQAEDFFAFKLALLGARHDLTTSVGKAKATDELLETLDLLENVVYRNLLCKELAQELGIDDSALAERQKGRRKPLRRKEVEPESGSQIPPNEAFLLEVMVHRPKLVGTVEARYPLGEYKSEQVRRIAAVLYDVLPRRPEIGLKGLLAMLSDPADASLLCEVAEMCGDPEELDRQLADFFGRLERERQQGRAAELKLALSEAEAAQDTVRMRQIMSEYASLMGTKRLGEDQSCHRQPQQTGTPSTS